LINVDEPSPNFDIPDNFDGAGHLFWDDLHPTTQTHELLADHVLASLDEQMGSAPEGGAAEASTSSSCFIGAMGGQVNKVVCPGPCRQGRANRTTVR
jgi:hypothetical protein